MKRNYLFFAVFFSIIVCLNAVELDDKIESLSEANAKEYLQPLLNSYSANVNSGLYNTAKVLKPITFGFFVNGSISFVPDEDKKFKIQTLGLEDESDYEEWINEEETATVFGDEGAEIGPEGEEVSLPNGADISAVPTAMPQFHLGLPKGNELMVRFMPAVEINKDIGDLGFWGLGFKHSVSQYLPLVPIDLALQGTYQSLSVGDIVDIESFSLNAQISKKLLMWTLYGGLSYENTKLTAEYEYEPNIEGEDYDPMKIDFESDADNDIRATVGFRYSLLLAKFYADYSYCKYPVVNLGIGLSF